MLKKLLRPQVVIPTSVLGAGAFLASLGAGLGILSISRAVFIFVVLAVMVAVALVTWLVVRRRDAQNLDKELQIRHERNAASASQDKKAKLDALRAEFVKNVDVLRKIRKKRGIPAIYYLPWYLVFGAPASGKSCLLKGSRFRFCVNDTPLKEGGTLNCDWWFTNQAIFLDTAGRLATQEGGAVDRAEWEQLLSLCRRFRRKRPIDGMIVTVEADKLLNGSERELRAYAQQLRERIDRVTEVLRVRCPVFVVITKGDLVDGFTEFFGALPEASLSQIVGWTNETVEYQGLEPVEQAFGEILSEIRRMRGAVLESEPSRENRRRLFSYPEELAGLQDPFLCFIDTLFQADIFSQSPFLAGFYLTSGTQEGSTVSQYFAKVGAQLGIPPERLGRTFRLSKEQRRPYFVQDLFWRIIARSVGLVVSVDSVADVRRRTWLGATATVLAGLLTVFTTLSLVFNDGYLDAFPERLNTALGRQAGVGWVDLEHNINDSAAAAELLAELDRHPILHNWGLNRRARLKDNALSEFRQGFEQRVWSPLWGPVVSVDRPDQACSTETELLTGYLLLTANGQAGRLKTEDVEFLFRARGFEPQDQALAEEFAKAWSAYWGTEHAAGAVWGTSVDRLGERVLAACHDVSNPLTALTELLPRCASYSEECDDDLERIARISQDEIARTSRSLNSLLTLLSDTPAQESTVARVREVLQKIDRGALSFGDPLNPDGAGESEVQCLELYFRFVQPELVKLVEAIGQRKIQLAAIRGSGVGREAERATLEQRFIEARKEFDEIESQLQPALETFHEGNRCDEFRLDARPIVRIGRLGLSPSAPQRGFQASSRPCPVPGYTREDWLSKASCLEETAKGVWGLGLPENAIQQRVKAIESDAKRYGVRFADHWKRKIRDAGAPGNGVKRLEGATEAYRAVVASVRKQMDGLRSDEGLTKPLEDGPATVLKDLNTLDDLLSGFEEPAQETATQLKKSSAVAIIDWARSDDCALARACEVVSRAGNFESLLLDPLTDAWGEAVTNQLYSERTRVRWQQATQSITELISGYPFDPEAPHPTTQESVKNWLGPDGKIQQLAGIYASREVEFPCGLSAEATGGATTRSFFDKAEDLSVMLFSGTADTPSHTFGLTVDAPAFAKPEDAERLEVKMTELILKIGQRELRYDYDRPTREDAESLLPASKSRESGMTVKLERLTKKSRKRYAPLEQRRWSGAWSDLRMLEDAERVDEGSGVKLTWHLRYADSTIVVSVHGDERMRRLLETDFALSELYSDDPSR